MARDRFHVGSKKVASSRAWLATTPSRWVGALCFLGLAACTAPAVDLACAKHRHATSVRNGPELRSALRGAPCGTAILVADGYYEGDFRLAASCPDREGILVRAANQGGPSFGGRFTLDGQGLTLAGIRFEGGGIVLVGRGNRATRNIVRGSAGPAIATFGSYHRVDRNKVDRSRGVGIEVRLDGGAGRNFGNVVELNHVHDQAGIGNGGEAIRILTDSYGCAGAVIQDNLLERVDVEDEGEAISVKTRCVAVRGTTLVDSPGSGIFNRHGSDNSYEGNFIVGGQGLVIYGDRHTVRHNRILGAPVRVQAGNGTQDTRLCEDRARPRPTLPNCRGVHPAARDVVVVDNEADEVIVGYRREDARVPEDVPAQRVTVSRSGRADLRHAIKTSVVPGAARGVTARRLTAGDVGPYASPDCAPFRHQR